MLITSAIRPIRMLLNQYSLSKYFETNTKDVKIIINASKKPHIQGPSINSEKKPTRDITKTDKRSVVFEKSNIFLDEIKL